MNLSGVVGAIRSYLYVPGDRPERIAKAYQSDADAVLIDLEDAVAPSAKRSARDHVLRFLDTGIGQEKPVWIRINVGAIGLADLVALADRSTQVSGLVLAKCETVEWLDEVAANVGADLVLAPLIESAAAVRRLDELCRHPRVQQCHLGEIDLLADLGAHPYRAVQLLTHARSEVVYASTAAGIFPPIGGVDPNIADLGGLATGSSELSDVGFGGRPAIHPSQIGIINAAFTPSVDDVDAAQQILTRYDIAVANGVGAVVNEHGAMLDEAVVRHARRVLARAGTLTGLDNSHAMETK